jgi:hypothetical protein
MMSSAGFHKISASTLKMYSMRSTALADDERRTYTQDSRISHEDEQRFSKTFDHQ